MNANAANQIRKLYRKISGRIKESKWRRCCKPMGIKQLRMSHIELFLFLFGKYCQIQDWKNFAQVICVMHQTKHASMRGKKYRAGKQFHTYNLKRNDLRVYTYLKDNKLAYFSNSWGSFQVNNLVLDFWKNVSGGARFFFEVHMCASLSKLCNCFRILNFEYWKTLNMEFEHDLLCFKHAYILEYIYIKHFWTLQ